MLVCFDVTGSNISRAKEAQKELPKLLTLLGKYLDDPQIAFAGNDDFTTSGSDCIQISDFESDNRIDEHLRNIWLVGRGGSNPGESYDLLLYAAARKTALDCAEKRDKKGYMFLYADEPFFHFVDPAHVKSVFGDTIQSKIPIAEIIEEARRLYNVFVIWPRGGQLNALEQYKELFGDEFVLESQDPHLLVELIGSVIGMYEKDLSAADAVTDLVAVGTSKRDADAVGAALVKVERGAGMTGALTKSGAAAAVRL